jgi:hypothetical protein
MFCSTDKFLGSAQSDHVGTRTKVPALAPIEIHRSGPEMGMELIKITIAWSVGSRESAHS